MKRSLALLALGLAISAALAQTAPSIPASCTPTTPCVQLTLANPSAAAIEQTGTNSAGAKIEMQGPLNVTLMKCIGGAAGCGTVTSPGPNGWVPVSTNPVLMTASPLIVFDPEAPGVLVNYSAQVFWTDQTFAAPTAIWTAPLPITVIVAQPPPVTATSSPSASGITLTVTTTLTTTVAPVQ